MQSACVSYFDAECLCVLCKCRVLEEGPVTVTMPSPPTVQHPPIPLEVFPIGEYAPLYRLPLDIQVALQMCYCFLQMQRPVHGM